MNRSYISIPLLSCLLSALSYAHVITGDSTQIDVSDEKAKELHINNYTGDAVINVPTQYQQVYVLGSAEIAPYSDDSRSLYVESDSSLLVNGDVISKIVQAKNGVINSTMQFSGNVTVKSMFAIAEPSNTVRIGGTLTINGLNSFVESGSNVYVGGVHVVKALTGVKVAGSIYTNSFVTSAASTTLQTGSLLAPLDPQIDGNLVIQSGSTVNCSGTVELDTELQGGTFSLNEAAVVSAVTLQSGTVNVLGDAQAGALTLNGGKIVFSDAATLNLNGAALMFDGDVSITVNVDDVNLLSGTIVLFENIASDSILPETLTVTLSDKSQSKQHEVIVQNGAVYLSIPEPASSSLAILGLATLLLRRRRR